MRIMMKKKGLGAPVVEPVVTGDPYWDNVVFLSHFDGVSGTNNFIEETGRILTPEGGIQHSSTQSKFGDSSADANDGYLSTTSTGTDFYWAISDYTVEAWVYPEQFTDYLNRPVLIGQIAPDTGTNYWSFGLSTTGELLFYYYNGSLNTVNSGLTVSLNEWTHIAMTHSNGSINLFAGGVKSNPIAVIGTPQYNNSYAMCVGRHRNVNFVGYADDIRITKGVARYTENFTPPTEAFPNTRDTSVPFGADRTMLETFGPLRGISKVETNGLTDANYTAKSIMGAIGGVPATGWDGYKINDANPASGIPVFDGITITSPIRGRGYLHAPIGEVNDQWWAVDMGKDVIVDSFCFYGWGGDGSYPNVGPQNFRFETSSDGTTWTPVLTDVCQQWPATDRTTRGSFHVLPSPVSSRYFRYFAIDNYGGALTGISYLELYAMPDKTKTYTAIGNVHVGAAATILSAVTPRSGFYTLKEALQDTTFSSVGGGTYGPLGYPSRVVVGSAIGDTYTEVLDAGAGKQFVVGDITIQAFDGTPESTDPFNVYVSDDNSSWTLAGQHLTEILGTINDDTTVPLSGVGRYLKLEVIPTYQISNYARLALSHCTQWNIRIQEVN